MPRSTVLPSLTAVLCKGSTLLLPLMYVVGLALSGCGSKPAPPPPEPTAAPTEGPTPTREMGIINPEVQLPVAVSNDVLGEIVNTIGQGYVRATILIPPGTHPGSYTVDPAALQAMAAAKLIVYTGFGFEPGIEAAINKLPDTTVYVAVAEQLPAPKLLYLPGQSAPKGQVNPCFWHDPELWAAACEAVMNKLMSSAPEHSERFMVGYKYAIQHQRNVDKRLRETVNRLPAESRFLVSLADTFPYFARRYGFEYLALYPPLSGSKPSAERIQEAAQAMNQRGVRLYYPDQLSREGGEELAAAGRKLDQELHEGPALLGFGLSTPGGEVLGWEATLLSNAEYLVDATLHGTLEDAPPEE